MKAIIKATGEVFKVVDTFNGGIFVKEGNDIISFKSHEVDLIPEQNIFKDEIDWEQRRYEIAKDTISGILSNQREVEYCIQEAKFEENEKHTVPKALAQYIVAIADALIEELKKEQR